MFVAAEAIRTFSALELLLAAFQAAAVVGVTLWVKVVLHRRRVMENNEARRLAKHRGVDQATESLRYSLADIANTRPLFFAAAHQPLRNPARKVRKRLNGAAARTNGFRSQAIRNAARQRYFPALIAR